MISWIRKCSQKALALSVLIHQSAYVKTAASVILKFIKGNKRCHTSDVPLGHERDYLQMQTTYIQRTQKTRKFNLYNDVVRGDILIVYNCFILKYTISEV